MFRTSKKKKPGFVRRLFNINDNSAISLGNLTTLCVNKGKEFISWSETARHRLKDIPQANFDLGLHHLKLGNISDAIMRFKLVTLLRSDHWEAFYYLGRSNILVNNFDKAEKYFEKSLQLNSENRLAQYHLQKVKTPTTIKQVPSEVIQDNFSHLSYIQDELMEEEIIDNITTSILTFYPADGNNVEILALGLKHSDILSHLKKKQLTCNITGVDIDPLTIDLAENNKISGEKLFKNLICAEASKYLSSNKEKYNLIIIDDCLKYNSDLESELKNIARNLNYGALIAAIFYSPYKEGDFVLYSDIDEFNYSSDYIKQSMENAGFTEIAIKELEPENSEPVSLFIFKLSTK